MIGPGTGLGVGAYVQDGKCAFRPSDLARGLDYATQEKSRVVVLPLQHSKPLGAAFCGVRSAILLAEVSE